MSAQKNCLSLIKYFLFVFNIFFFVSSPMAPQPWSQSLPQPQPPDLTAHLCLPSTLPHYCLLPQALGSLIFCFGIWILVDKTSFVSFVGERGWDSGEDSSGIDLGPASPMGPARASLVLGRPTQPDSPGRNLPPTDYSQLELGLSEHLVFLWQMGLCEPTIIGTVTMIAISQALPVLDLDWCSSDSPTNLPLS